MGKSRNATHAASLQVFAAKLSDQLVGARDALTRAEVAATRLPGVAAARDDAESVNDALRAQLAALARLRPAERIAHRGRVRARVVELARGVARRALRRGQPLLRRTHARTHSSARDTHG